MCATNSIGHLDGAFLRHGECVQWAPVDLRAHPLYPERVHLRACYRAACERVLALWPAGVDPDDLSQHAASELGEAMIKVARLGERLAALDAAMVE